METNVGQSKQQKNEDDKKMHKKMELSIKKMEYNNNGFFPLIFSLFIKKKTIQEKKKAALTLSK